MNRKRDEAEEATVILARFAAAAIDNGLGPRRVRIGTKPQTYRVSSGKICRVRRILNRGSPIKVTPWMLKTAIDQRSRLMPGRGICSMTCADAMSVA
jgi:hypothetical protein